MQYDDWLIKLELLLSNSVVIADNVSSLIQVLMVPRCSASSINLTLGTGVSIASVNSVDDCMSRRIHDNC